MEPDAETDRLARRVIGAAIEVHRQLGPGFREAVYEESLSVELSARSVPFLRQPTIVVAYKGSDVGHSRPDFLVGNSIVVEVEAAEALLGVHQAQIISYLRATDRTVGLLLNFGEKVMRTGIRRFVNTRVRR